MDIADPNKSTDSGNIASSSFELTEKPSKRALKAKRHRENAKARSLCASLSGSFDSDRLKRIERGIKKASKQAAKELSFGIYTGRLACESRDEDIREISREAHKKSETRNNQVRDLLAVKEALVKGKYI